MNDRTSLLLVNDVTGYGRVSTFCMMPVCARFGLHPYVLPTALVSNTMDYGSAEILDTTAFMKSTINKWKYFGFKFRNICTGLINSAEQVDIICELIDSQDNPFVMVDPIMADDGKLYPDMYEGAVEANRKLASRASLMIPNFTEATMLAGMFTDRTTLSGSEFEELVKALVKLGPDSIVITGCHNDEGRSFNLVYESGKGEIEYLYYDRLPVSFIGTGDVFSSVLISHLLTGAKLGTAVERAARFVREVIFDNLDNKDHYDLHIEKSLNKLQI